MGWCRSFLQSICPQAWCYGHCSRGPWVPRSCLLPLAQANFKRALLSAPNLVLTGCLAAIEHPSFKSGFFFPIPNPTAC